MMRATTLGIWLVACGGLPLMADDPAPPAPISAEQEQFFESRVRPVLVQKCWECHGPDLQENGLRLDSREAILAGAAEGRKVVESEQPETSRLLRAVRHEGDLQMPPGGKLSDDQIAALDSWVRQGLPWPRRSASGDDRQSLYDAARRAHWAYQPIVRPPQPAVRNAAWLATGVDAFVLAKLEAIGLGPSPAADRRTLLRRLSFDLLGLPPDPVTVEMFVQDPAPDAYERLVDRLLASPRYGERWGRHWLDVARYADTRGYAFGRERRFPYAYTYRDYVIAALNRDLPYRQFVLEQLAADQLPLGTDKRPLAALGFLTVGRRFNNPHDDIDDRIDVTARGLLGLTVGCARCHDHKYDAIPMADYYSLYGVFASVHEPGELPLIVAPDGSAALDRFQEELGRLRRNLEHFQQTKQAEITAAARRDVLEYLVRAAIDQPEEELAKLPFISKRRDDLKPKLIDRWRKFLVERAPSDHPVWGPLREIQPLSAEQFAAQAADIVARWRSVPEGTEPGQLNSRVRALLEPPLESKAELVHRYGQALGGAYQQWQAANTAAETLAALPADVRQLAEILVAGDSPTAIAPAEIKEYLPRDARDQHSELERQIEAFQANSPDAPPRAMVLLDNDQPVEPRIFLRGNHARPGDRVPRQFLYVLSGPARQPFRQGSGRRELAEAIVADDNPLTARVLANRVWMYHMGQPLVSTPSDFGARTEPPVHQPLLDYLADVLRQHDWSLKSLHRAIVLSSTYRQTSHDRPEAVAVDPENRFWWRAQRRRLEFEPLRDALFAVAGELDETMEGRPVDALATTTRRRAVYGLIDRQDLPNLLRVFDFASPDQSAAERPKTTVPQQALFLLNSPLVMDRARALAAHPELAALTDEPARIGWLYRRLFARQPEAAEVEAGARFLTSAAADPDAQLSPWEQLAHVLLLTNEFLFVD